jgi:hypothetical protein
MNMILTPQRYKFTMDVDLIELDNSNIYYIIYRAPGYIFILITDIKFYLN